MAETFCSLEDDEGLPPAVKAAGQFERLASVLEPLAHDGVEVIPSSTLTTISSRWLFVCPTVNLVLVFRLKVVNR